MDYTSKREYQKPKLKEYGNLKSITLGNGQGYNDANQPGLPPLPS